MSKDRWEVLRNCADFQEIYDYVFNKYGVEDYCSILDKIEDELETYENSSSEKWQEAVENGKYNETMIYWEREVNNMKASKVNAINKIAIKGDRNEPVIAAIQNIEINHPELYKELSKVIDVELWDGYSLMIHEEIE